MTQFHRSLDRMESSAGIGMHGLFESIRSAYDAYLESGTSFKTATGKPFTQFMPWTPEEDELIISGERNIPGRSDESVKCRRKKLARMGHPELLQPRPARSATIPEIDEYEITREPPEWVMEKYGGQRVRAKKYMDHCLEAKRRKAAKDDGVEYQPIVRDPPWTVAEYAEAIETNGKRAGNRTQGASYGAMRRIRQFLGTHPELANATPEEQAVAYKRSQQNSWHDLIAGGVTVPSSDSTLALSGLSPDGHSESAIHERRVRGARDAAIRGIRAGMGDMQYMPTNAEIDGYIANHNLDRDSYAKVKKTYSAEDMSRIARGIRPVGMTDAQFNTMRFNLERQGLTAEDFDAPPEYASSKGYRNKRYAERDKDADLQRDIDMAHFSRENAIDRV